MYLFVYGWPSTGYGSTLFPDHSQFSQAGFLRRLLWESLAAHVRLLSFVYMDVSMFNHAWYSHLFCLVLASRSVARGGSVAGSPKVHDRGCLIRLHTMTALLDFTRCSPSCSSYIRRTFVRLSCTYNQLTHSHQQVMSPAVATE
jgi:hypothetical protein